MATDVVVFFALKREARPFRRLCPAVPVMLTQVGVERARIAVETYLQSHSPKLLILAGFGGALSPSLAVGDVIVAKDVIAEDGTISQCHPVPDANGRILTVNRMIATVEEKKLLGTKHSAAVCDMESSVVAELCRRHGVPFLAVRAVSDDAKHSLSPTLDRIIVNGKVSAWQVLRAIVTEPTILRDFRRLARGTKRAAERQALRLKSLIDQSSLS
ncbi:hypothetical protein BH11PLA2_BH11PLA2_40050 [soil metagenome]